MKKKKVKEIGITALYERLSRDDDGDGDSNSIVHQKQMLEAYAKEHGFVNLRHYTDDGWSGASFDRPAWNELVAGVKAEEITTVIVKDLSRVGRDHLQVGFFTDILFREKEVHFIAIGNGIDSNDQQSSEFAPFLNIMNEWYVRDTSKKIKSVLKARGMSGSAHTSNCACYGYKKDPENPDKWVIDEEAASVVREIFQMCVDGKGPYEIARCLAERKVERPSYYLAKRGLGNHQSDCDYSNPYTWRGHTVATIQERPEYTGCTVNFRTYKNSYRTKDIDALIRKIYEDNIAGRLSDKMLENLLEGYEKEKNELEEEQKDCQQQLDSAEKQADNTNHFIELAKKYTDFSELTPAMVNEFVSKIIVHRPFELNGTRAVQVEVYLNYIGKFDVPEEPMILSEEELATQKIREEKLEKHRIASRKYMAKYRKRLKEMKKAGTILPENLPAETKGEWL